MNHQNPTCISCGIQTFRRNTYFNGKLLVERDFNDEQAYLVGKDRLHNSLLHGMGTVCGLKVLAHPNPECQSDYVYITPGLALDCCGREIIVTQNLLVPLLDLIEAEEISLDPESEVDLFISLCYKETLEEKIPVILPDCDCAEANQAYNRVRESYELHLFAQPVDQRPPVRPPLRAKLDWRHTLSLARQSPRAIAVDDELQQLYVAAQMLPAPDDEPETELGARLYAFRTDTHDLITAVNAGQTPTDLALSLLGDLIFLATAGLAGPPGEGEEPSTITGIAVFREADIRSEPEPAAIIDLGEPARLIVSAHTGALFALLLNSGELRAWSDESLRTWLNDPTGVPVTHSLTLSPAFSSASGPALAGAAMMSVTLDGRYLFLADPDNPDPNHRVRVVDVARLFSDEGPAAEITPAINPTARPLALATSRDSTYLYVLWTGTPGDGVGQASLSRYRLDSSSGSLQLAPDGVGGQWPTQARDLALAPDDRWAYVLQMDEQQSRVQVISIDAIASPTPEGAAGLLGTRENISGQARYERLAVLGGRLYVAADDEATDVQPERGLVAILEVEEAACDDIFARALDSCPACQNGEAEADHCVVLAHLPEYRLGARVQDAGQAGADDVVIDNLTHRPLVPSTNNIVEVLRCMLEQGLAEGIPGPRGPAGPEGSRGPGITEVDIESLEPGSTPTATLEPLAEDPEGDQLLTLGIPLAQDGEAGPRGPGITQVTVTTLAPNTDATASLAPITGDPEGDQELRLGLPRGQQGPPGVSDDPELTHIVALSWAHGATLFSTLNEFVSFLRETGLVIAFDGEVQMKTVFTFDEENEVGQSEIFQLYVRHEDEFGYCECLILPLLCEPVEVAEQNESGRITAVKSRPLGTDRAEAVRLWLDDSRDLPDGVREIEGPIFFRVVFRSDFALNSADKAIDGNHIGGLVPTRPTGNGRQGGTFESWFTVDQQGDE